MHHTFWPWFMAQINDSKPYKAHIEPSGNVCFRILLRGSRRNPFKARRKGRYLFA